MKKLIIYYSYTGNTKKIATTLQTKLDCDILELEPSVPFSSNYDEVVAEYQNNETVKKTPELKPISVALSNYDEIILGTPVWWYTISPVMRSFLKNNDLSAKKVYVFATNAGWLGRTFKEYASLCPNIIDFMNIVFEPSTSHHQIKNIKEVNDWIIKIS